ncbi:MAG: M1 family aminopeptidase [Bryobacteraceae bacterium]
MRGNKRFTLISAGLAIAIAAMAQDRGRQPQRSSIDVQSYTIDARIDPTAQTLNATALVRFTPIENTSTVSFELNNALNLSKVTDEAGNQVPASRTQDVSVTVNLPQPLVKGKPAALTFVYDGKLNGAQDSPLFGIKFAAIHPDFAYLMYPSRWFPVNDYTADRFSADLKITVPAGFKALASGIETTSSAPEGMTTTEFRFDQPSFPGSLAVVRGDAVPVSSGGVTTSVYARDAAAAFAQSYGEEIDKAMVFFTGIFGSPIKKDLTVVETEDGAPNGYAAPGLLFLAPNSFGKTINQDLIANQVSRQWWGMLVSPTTRNHLWIQNGMARYSEFLFSEQENGAGAADSRIHDTYVEALTVDQPPLIQSSRLEDYSPEFWAATQGKGAAVINMLRGVIGDDNFSRLLMAIPNQFAFKSISTDDFRKTAEQIYGQELSWFFTEWIESSGAPEFKMSYTIFRTQKAPGFRVVGKITQDLDLFRMPVDLRVETEGNPETKKIEVVGTSSEFAVETFGNPKKIILDPKDDVLHFDDNMRVEVAIKRGEQYALIGEYNEALQEYQKALDVERNSSLAHYRVAEIFFLQQNWQPAANEFREALNGDLTPKWTEVWAHINLGKIFDISDQRDRAVNEYRLAIRTKDDTQGALEQAQKYMNQKFTRPKSTN